MESKLYNYAKCSVPILNNTSPNNYTIMSALLSHIDSPLVSSNSQLSSSINSYPNIISSLSFPNQTIQSTFSKSVRQRSSPHKHTKCTNDHTSPKEIIYTTKRINLPNLEQTEPNQNMILLESNSDLNISESAANLTSDQFQNEQINNLIVIEARKEFEMGTAASMINSNSIQNDYSVENNFENNASQASQILDQINFEAYKNYVFNEQPNFINDQSEQSTFNETNGHAQDSNLVTYTISCPSNWQHNLDQMLNCFVLLDHFKTENVQLKCSICLKKFYDINDLVKHKELNDSCLNRVKIQEEFEISNGFEQNFANLDENFDQIFSDEDEEDFDKLNEGVKSFFLNENELDLSDESNESEIDSEKSTCYYNNKFISKVKLKNSQRVRLRDDSSEIDKEDIQIEKMLKSNQNKQKENKPRRKYTKSKASLATNLNCDKCNKTCRTKAELLVHLHKHAGNGAECWQCGKKCASFSNLVSHVQLHTGEKPYTCQFCGKQFTQDAHLTRHIRLHTGERPFVCNICGKNYKDYSYYKTHLRIHKGERLYKCNYCGKEYYDASYYKKHTRLHTGEKPYMCTVCGRQFHRSDYLKLHSYSHTDERPYNCHICGKGFKMNYNLKLHLKNHEDQDLASQSAVVENAENQISYLILNSNNS